MVRYEPNRVESGQVSVSVRLTEAEVLHQEDVTRLTGIRHALTWLSVYRANLAELRHVPRSPQSINTKGEAMRKFLMAAAVLAVAACAEKAPEGEVIDSATIAPAVTEPAPVVSDSGTATPDSMKVMTGDSSHTM